MNTLDKVKLLELNNIINSVGEYPGLSLQEILSNFYNKINELTNATNTAIENVNDMVNVGLIEEVSKRIQVLIDSGELKNLISEELLNDLTEKIRLLEIKVNEYYEELSTSIKTVNVLIDTNKSHINVNTQDIENIRKELTDLRVLIQDKNNSNDSNTGGDKVEDDTIKEVITTRIAIDAGHDSSWDPGCAWATGGNEAGHTRELANKVIEILTNAGCINILDVQKVATGTTTSTNLASRTQSVNNWNADVCVSIHFNSNSGTPGAGTETYIIATGGKAETLAKRVNNLICESIGTINRGVKVGNLAMVRDTICPAILIEVLFANNTSDIAKYNVEKVAKAICEGILNKSLDSSKDDNNINSGNYLNGKADKEGLKLIKAWEGFGQTSYTDSVGYRTMGYGTTEKWQKDAFNSMLPSPTTEEKATNALVTTLENDYGKALFNYISSKGKLGVLNQNRFNALLSLCYNKGTSNLTSSSLLTAIFNDPTSGTVETLFKSYQTLPGTSAEQGLKNRRISEYEVYCGNTCNRSIAIYNGTTNTGNVVSANGGYGYIPTGY